MSFRFDDGERYPHHCMPGQKAHTSVSVFRPVSREGHVARMAVLPHRTVWHSEVYALMTLVLQQGSNIRLHRIVNKVAFLSSTMRMKKREEKIYRCHVLVQWINVFLEKLNVCENVFCHR